MPDRDILTESEYASHICTSDEEESLDAIMRHDNAVRDKLALLDRALRLLKRVPVTRSPLAREIKEFLRDA